ncbi:MAG: ligase-associated DNA damage response endonuclease PdeM [Pseudomonadota bacterium]
MTKQTSTFCGMTVRPDPAGGLYLEDAHVLVVSDLHLEKGTAYHARRGLTLPPYDTRTTLGRVRALVDLHQPQTVIALGDSFHDTGAEARLDADDREAIRTMTASCDWVWVLGNHDPVAPSGLGGRAAEEVAIGDVVLRHEPVEDGVAEIVGHLHPCAMIAGKGRRVRRRCFAVGRKRIIMPAFGAYAGGLNVLDPAFGPWMGHDFMAWMMGKDRIFPVEAARLLADAGSSPAGSARLRA